MMTNKETIEHNPCDYCIEFECETHGVVCPFYKEKKEADMRKGDKE